MIASIFDLEKNRNMLWNQGSQLFHLPHETEFFHEIFIFSTSLVSTWDRCVSVVQFLRPELQWLATLLKSGIARFGHSLTM